MSYLEYNVKYVPTGLRKILYINWPLVLLLIAIASFGFLMLYSVAGGSFSPWAAAQMKRFAVGMVLMFLIGFVPIYLWRNLSPLFYGVSLFLLVMVEVAGVSGMGAQRWIDLGFIRLQPSELMKIALVLVLAAYYDWLDTRRINNPFWVLIPVLLILIPSFLVIRQPDLGTTLLLMVGGAAVIFFAGVHWLYFVGVLGAGVGVVVGVFMSRGTEYQLLKDYQYRRIDTFLDPSADPLGAGYNIIQAKIALGSGGWTGRGFMQGTQTRLNFVPEKHTDFILTTLAEEFGFVGAASLLALYAGVLIFAFSSAFKNKDRFAALMIMGLSVTFFLYFAVNMAMVMGLAPVVGVPLPLVSYGGSAMLVILISFGFIQSAHIHRPR